MDAGKIFTHHDNGFGDRTWIETQMILSEAFLALGQKGTSKSTSSISTQILLMFLAKRQFRYLPAGTGKNRKKELIRVDENKFTLTHKETESRGIKQGMRIRAIDELIYKGFIKIVHPGGQCEKDKALYGLSDDWMQWKPGFTMGKRPKDVHRGYQGKCLGVIKKRMQKQNSHTSTGDTHIHANEGHTRTSTGDTSPAIRMVSR